MKKAVLLFVFSISLCFAQETADLYKDYIPSVVKKNYSTMQQVSAPMAAYAEIHPDLIYYYIKYLHERFDPASNDNYFKENFLKIKTIYSNNYNNWLNKIKKEINNENIDNYLKETCLNYVEDHKLTVTKNPKLDFSSKTDSTLLNFFTVRYYTQNADLKFDENKNYYKEKIELENKRAELFMQMINYPSNFNKEDLNKVFDSWNIFEDLNLSRQNIKPSLIITKVLKNYDSDNRLYKKWSLGLGFSYQHGFFTRSGNIYNTTKYSPDVSNNFIVKPFSFSVNYKYFLSEYIKRFCYINLQLTAGYGSANKHIELEQQGYWNKNVDGISNRSEIFDFTTNNANVNNMMFAGLNFSTPLIFLGRTFSIDGGAGISMLRTSYNISYDYSYRKFESGFITPNIIESETGSAVDKKETANDIFIYPILYFKYYSLRPVVLQFIITTKSVSFETTLNL